jgi:hypothetical protein
MATLTYKKRPVIVILDVDSSTIDLSVGVYEEIINKKIIPLLEVLPGINIEDRHKKYYYTVSIDQDYLDLNDFKLYLKDLFQEYYFEIDFENEPRPQTLAGRSSGEEE